MLMVDTGNTELVACCIPLETQHATISQNSATNSATTNATNSLKALARAVLGRNKPYNYNATDTLKPTQLIDAKKPELVALPLQGVLSESDKQIISAWVYSLGGSEETIIEELSDCLGQCRNDSEALGYYLKRAEEVGTVTPPIALIQCGNCNHFEPYHGHGRGSGTCKVGVKSAGICHWSETLHTCAEFSVLIDKRR
jgi:hypothetical protein